MFSFFIFRKVFGNSDSLWKFRYKKERTNYIMFVIGSCNL